MPVSRCGFLSFSGAEYAPSAEHNNVHSQWSIPAAWRSHPGRHTDRCIACSQRRRGELKATRTFLPAITKVTVTLSLLHLKAIRQKLITSSTDALSNKWNDKCRLDLAHICFVVHCCLRMMHTCSLTFGNALIAIGQKLLFLSYYIWMTATTATFSYYTAL